MSQSTDSKINYFALQTCMIIHQGDYEKLRTIEKIKEKDFPDLPRT